MTLKELREVFTSAREGKEQLMFAGLFSVSVIIDSGTLKLQRSVNNGLSWQDVDTYTSSTEDTGLDPEGGLYRFECSSYTSGTLIGRVGQ